MCRGLLLALTLLASTALARGEEYVHPDAEELGEVAPVELQRVGRASIQTGWRQTPNGNFYRSYYATFPELERAPSSPGGPLLVGSFAYSFFNSLELSIDLIVTGEQLKLTGQPMLTTMTFAGLVGARFQRLMPSIGPEGLIPFVGLLAGPSYIVSWFEGAPSYQEDTPTMFGACAGATLRLSPRWGLTAEYRVAFAKVFPGFARQPNLELQRFRDVNAGGHWFSLGVTYVWPARKPPGAGDRFTPF